MKGHRVSKNMKQNRNSLLKMLLKNQTDSLITN